ncbi:MAG: hypothetical protein ACTSYD_13950 [Candidatus Heimdallarchaeaceae archaeon]
MKKKLVATTLAFLFILVFSTQVRGMEEELQFHDDIVPGATFKWNIETLSYSGDFTSDDMNMSIGDYVLTEGDVIKIEVTADPNTLDWESESWLNVYVNDQLALTNSSEIYTDEGNEMMFFPMWPIYPVIYINDTGTYNLFEAMYPELKEEEIHNTTSDSDTYGDYVYYMESKQILEFSLENNEFETYVYFYLNMTQENTVTNEVFYAIAEITNIIRVDTVKGLLNQYYMKVYGETNMSTEGMAQDEGPMNGKVEISMVREGYNPPDEGGTNTFVIPFEGLYALFGIGIVALVIYRRKKH